MAQTKEGAAKAVESTRRRHGKDFYHNIGFAGGTAEHVKPRGFAARPDLAAIAGAIGGHTSRRYGYLHPVKQIDIETDTTIARFPSVVRAAAATGLNRINIGRAARTHATAGGFRWEYL